MCCQPEKPWRIHIAAWQPLAKSSVLRYGVGVELTVAEYELWLIDFVSLRVFIEMEWEVL